VLPLPRGDVRSARAVDFSPRLPDAVGDVPGPLAFLFLLQAPADSTNPPTITAQTNLVPSLLNPVDCIARPFRSVEVEL
jgi:hypothetical protein